VTDGPAAPAGAGVAAVPGDDHRPTTAERRVEARGVSLTCRTSPDIDDRDRPLAVCLHGFPDTAHTWRHLVPRVEAAGYRVVAPFLRGYAPSDVPADGSVQTGASVADVLDLHEHFGGDERAVLVGHDWGAVIAYGAAALEPDRWARLVGLAVPPGGAMGAAFVSNVAQLKRSWYMFFFLHPLADLVVAADDLPFLDTIWRDWSPGYDAAHDLALVKDALRDPAHLAAALGYYRATLGDGPTDPAHDAAQQATAAVPPQPVLYLHGADDGCVGVEVAESARGFVGGNVTIEVVPDTGHFLHLEAPDVVGSRILEFLS
jgi:pimeloyl-ACP methyl ester carboxylesterase